IGTTTPVGLYPGGDSPYGVSDMAGNVWEWTADDYRTSASPPHSPGDGKKVVRGAGYRSVSAIVRCSYPNVRDTTDMGDDLGFRCVASGNMTGAALPRLG